MARQKEPVQRLSGNEEQQNQEKRKLAALPREARD